MLKDPSVIAALPGLIQWSWIAWVLLVFAGAVVLFLGILWARSSRKSRRLESELAEVREHLSRVQHLEELTASRLRESVLGLREFLAKLNEKVQAHAASYSDLSSMMEQFAASIDMSNSATENQIALIDSVASQAAEVEELLRSVRAAGNELQANMETARAGTESVTQSAQDLAHAMADIESAFATVSQVTKIMTELSDRTNLLSLNASIEAARSGEHGRGFAVVAEEISKLADKSAANAKQIASVVSGNASAIATGHSSAQVAGNKVRDQRTVFISIAERYAEITDSVQNQIRKNEDLVASVRRLRDLSHEISGAAREQKAGIDSAMNSLLSMEASTSSLVSEANFIEQTARLIEEQAQSLHSDYHAEFRRAEEWMLSRVREIVARNPFQAEGEARDAAGVDAWMAAIAPEMPAVSFRLYLCDGQGNQLSANFRRGAEGFQAQPEFRGSNWSSRAYFSENMARVTKSGGGSLSGQYIDREIEKETVTLTMRVAENVFLFVDLTPDFDRMI